MRFLADLWYVLRLRFGIWRVSHVYPDWLNIAGSKEFLDWIETQPSDLREKRHSVRAKDALALLDAFKAR